MSLTDSNHSCKFSVPPGRDTPAKPSERGEASPHAPSTSPESAAALRSDPPHRSAPLRASALAPLHSNAPHRSPSLRSAHRLRSFPRRPLLENLLRRHIPFGNPCKLYVTHGNIAKANYQGYELAGLVGTAASNSSMSFPCPGSGRRAGIARAIRLHPPS